MEHISKPRIVDFLRTCDKHNWVYPRIRFASVRSKPELIRDINEHFVVCLEETFVCITPRRHSRRIPAIQYDLEARKYLLNGEYRELQRESRRKPSFVILRHPVTIQFADFHGCVNHSSTHITSAPLSPFLKPNTGVLQAGAS